MTIIDRYVELHPSSAQLAARASHLFPDGVTHDIRHNPPFPLYVTRASASRKWDVDDNEIVDYVMGHGALLLGHNHPVITAAVNAQLQLGTHYGASHEAELTWGELVQRLVPSAERLRFTSSGTEATMMALRLARAATGREKILRLREHFHGWNDSVTGQPAAEETLPRSPGLPRALLDASIVIPPNDREALERTLREDGSLIAAMILEPTGAHWGTEPIDVEYVRYARQLTAAHGILLIYDEVITGFRVSAGGAQREHSILPDLTTMAKIVAGGLPGGCVAGRAGLLEQIAIAGGRRDSGSERIAHPGTFNANPLSAAAGSACLALIADGTHQARAAATAATIARHANGVLREESVPGCVYGYSSMLHIALGEEMQPEDGYSWGAKAPPRPIRASGAGVAHLLRLGMLNEGIHLMDSGMMVSSVHDGDDVGRTVNAFRSTLRALKSERAF